MVHAPISLLPSPLPRSAYDQVVALARDFNVLVHRASNDHAFICSSLERCPPPSQQPALPPCVAHSSFRLVSAARADSFTASLLAIYKKVYADGKRQVRCSPCTGAALRDCVACACFEPLSVVWRVQAIELGLHRSDYMMHQQPEGPPIPLQVELNTISSAFACLSSNVAQMHRHAVHLLRSTLRCDRGPCFS